MTNKAILLAAVIFSACGPMPPDDRSEIDEQDRNDQARTDETESTSGPESDEWLPSTGDAPPPESPPPPIDYEVPADFPQLNSRFKSNATWRFDDSGYESVPNNVYRELQDIPVEQGVEESGAYWWPVSGTFVIRFQSVENTAIFELPLLEPGVYEAGHFDTELLWSDDRDLGYQTEAGDGSITIVGSNGKAVWGTFEARVCSYLGTCKTVYEGRFSAADESND